MKKEWTEAEHKMVLRTIKYWINSRKFVTRHYGEIMPVKNIGELEYLFGLPYTSSCRAACVGVTNTELYLDEDRKYNVVSFEMDDYQVVYAVCFDNEENELLIPISL